MKKALKNLIPTDAAIDYAEMGVDHLIDNSKQYLPVLDDVSKEVPVVKTLVAAVKVKGSISDAILGTKVNAFLYSSNLDQKKLDKFKKKFSKAKQEKLWERVVLAINAHDDKQKSGIIGKLFAQLIDEFISYEEFFDMVHATNSLNLNNLEQLREIYTLTDESNVNPSLFYMFATLRLVDVDSSMVGGLGSGGPVYPLNQLGWKYVGIIFDFPQSSIPGVQIGKVELVRELDDAGRATGKALPLATLNARNSRHAEVEVFLVNSQNEVLCSQADGLPLSIGSMVVPAGDTPSHIVGSILQNQHVTPAQPPKRVTGRHMESGLATKEAYVAQFDAGMPNADFKTPHAIKELIINNRQHTDHTRYIIAVVEELMRP